MAKLNPYVKINDGKCREAMQFYKDALGGELEFMTVKGSPMEKDMPEDKHHLVMHSTLKKGDWMLIGSDMMRDKAVIGDNVGISLHCESEQEIKDTFTKLSKGGEIFMPLEEVFWGGLFGVFTDKYGVEWMLDCQETGAKK
jgi:PhnB protein